MLEIEPQTSCSIITQRIYHDEGEVQIHHTSREANQVVGALAKYGLSLDTIIMFFYMGLMFLYNFHPSNIVFWGMLAIQFTKK